MSVQTEEIPNSTVDNEEIEAVASLEHGIIGSIVNGYLMQYVYPRNLGIVCDAQTTFRVVGNPPSRQPVVAFVSAERVPSNLRLQADFAPDLAVEIISENDKTFELDAKILQYLQSGVKMIWVINAFSRKVEVYRQATGLIQQVVGMDSELDGADIIPGFKLSVASLFPNFPKH